VRVVADTNILISYALRNRSPVGLIVSAMLERWVLLYSAETLDEFARTVFKPKFAPYLDRSIADALLRQLVQEGEHVAITDVIAACRDPKDDKFLSLAVSGHADMIVSGDNDLLALHPFRGIAILRPSEVVFD
jgi:putative PIN family toxin of toxin-antitoxin system